MLGIVPQEIALYPTLTAAENLRFWGKMYGLSGKQLADAVEYGLKMAGLEDRAKSRVETFSGGMKRRINIAAGILHRPRVLLMDEPTVGIDPQSRNHILDTVRELNREGMTVLYTSHYMEEVEALCDRIAIVDHGKVIATGSLEELRALVGDEDRIRVRVGEASSGLGDEPTGSERRVRSHRGGARAVGPRRLRRCASRAAGISRAEMIGGAIDVLAPEAAAVLGSVVGAIAGRARTSARSRSSSPTWSRCSCISPAEACETDAAARSTSRSRTCASGCATRRRWGYCSACRRC